MNERPIMRTRSSTSYAPVPRSRGISWWWSLLFAAGLIGVLLTLLLRPSADTQQVVQATRTITITVTDSATGAPLQDALVTAGAAQAVTDGSGVAQVAIPDGSTTITISHDGYEPVYGTADAGSAATQAVAMNPSVAGIDPAAAAPTQADVSVQVSATQPAAQPSAPAPSVGAITGIITDASGIPLNGATVVANGQYTNTALDGTYTLQGVAPGDTVRVWASGYADQVVAVPDNTQVSLQLNRMDIRAAYLTGPELANTQLFNDLVDLIDRTDLNALVIVVKEYGVYYNTGVQFFIDAEAVNTVFDPQAYVDTLHQHGIYAIARLVTFNDPLVAQNRPDLALKDINGEVWIGANDLPWVNPFYQDLWQPNIDLGIELGAMGYDEIQFDYVRFPSDGDLSTADFAPDYSEEARVGNIVAFLKLAHSQLAPRGIKTAADVFAIIAVYPDDQGIGQRFTDFTAVVDYISPMIYPSHFTAGALGMDGDPNAYPGETVEITMQSAMSMIPPDQALRVRPWIQDFSWGDVEYGPAEVQAQIDAIFANGGSGYMLWNPESIFTEGALGPP